MTIKSQKQENDATEEASLKDFIFKLIFWFKFLLSKWVIIFCFGILGALLGFTYGYLKKPVYVATTTFVLEENSNSGGVLGNLGGLASMAGIDIGSGGGLFTGDNIIELYKSRTMIKKALLTKAKFDNKEELLIDRFIEFNKLKEKWTKVNWNDVSFADTMKVTKVKDSIISEIYKDINKTSLNVSKPDKKLSIIKVEVKSKDEAFAKSFSDEIVSSVNQFYIQTKTKRSTRNVEILQHKTDSVRAVMSGAINMAAAVVDATPNINPSRQAQRNAPVQRAQFSAETNKAVLGELVKNLELSKISLLKETPLIQIIDQPIFPLEKEKLSKLKALIVGGILLSLLISAFLILKQLLKS